MNMKTGRRELLKILGATPILAVPAAAQTPPLHVHPPPAAIPTKGPAKPISFSAKEFQTIRVLADIIIPADAQSGSASQAGVAEYIDEVVSDPERKDKGRLLAQIHGGIAWLNLAAKRRFKTDFTACKPDEQKQIVDLIAYPKKAAPEHSQAVAFFNRFRDLTASGFYTSKIGIKDLQFKGNQIVSHWDGCPPEVLAKLGL
jgi:gluconate 2-dehydrogenase gamma chain